MNDKTKEFVPANAFKLFVPGEQLSHTRSFTLMRAVRRSDGRAVIIRASYQGLPTPRLLERLDHEFAITRDMVGAPLLRGRALHQFADRLVLEFEDFSGLPLPKAFALPLEPAVFLEVAPHLCAGLAALHACRVVHSSISPGSILIDRESGAVRFTDLDLARQAPYEQPHAVTADELEAPLPYLAPEQTGRTHWAIDGRSDLYSLGAVFYEILTGIAPFRARDPLEWVHCHLARTPEPPATRRPAIPAVLSALVLKLLAKSPEERYQSAAGVKADLESCLEQWRARSAIAPFPLGRKDVSPNLVIPHRLYGRDREIKALCDSHARVVANGVPEVMLVSGFAGIGKSRLVQQVHEALAGGNVWLIDGKFDQYKRDIPYAGVLHAFQQALTAILSEPEAQIRVWRERLRHALASNGRVLTAVLPDLELIIGPQAPVAELPLAEAQQRFNNVFQELVRVLASSGRSLLVFLDDLQWADEASLTLLEYLITSSDTRNLLVIGAFRDNEVSPSHPLMLAVVRMRQQGARVGEIVLGPLESEHLYQLVADTLHRQPGEIALLSDIISEKTGGNPFFFIHFLRTLHADGVIRFDPELPGWIWSDAETRARGYSDNVVEFMVQKLRRLGDTATALGTAACVGDVVEACLLAQLLGWPPERVEKAVAVALAEGLLVQRGEALRFLHDRIRQAAYALEAQEQRDQLHLQIGRKMLRELEAGRTSVFDAANQLNHAERLLTERGERLTAARLNLIAALSAKSAAAFLPALQYFEAGRALLPADAWETEYELTHALCLGMGECCFIAGRWDEAGELLHLTMERSRTRLEKAAVCRRFIELFIATNENTRAVELGSQVLALYGIEISVHPAAARVSDAYAQLKRNLGKRSIDEIMEAPPPPSDDDIAGAIDVLMTLWAPALFLDNDLLALTQCVAASLCLTHGNTAAAPLAYAMLGYVLCGHFGEYALGFRFAKGGYDLMTRRGSSIQTARVCLTLEMVAFWSHPIRSNLGYLRQGLEAAMAMGDLTYACYCASHILTVNIVVGEHLNKVYELLERYLHLAQRTRIALEVGELICMQRFLLNLRGETNSFSTFDGPGFDQEQFEAEVARSWRSLSACWYYILKLQARVFSEDYDEALATGRLARELIWSSITHMQVPEFWFYWGLALAGASSPDIDCSRREELREVCERYRSWAESSPENYANRYALLSAEQARLRGENQEAKRLCAEAIALSRRDNFIQNEGLAHELLGRLHLRDGEVELARQHLSYARLCYTRWGARGKVQQLERRYSELLAPALDRPESLGPGQLDLLAVIKASHAISGEIQRSRLIETLLRIVTELAGAQKAVLLLPEKGELIIVAEAQTGAEGVVISQEQGSAAGRVPESVVQYVARTRRGVLLNEPEAVRPFSDDAYLLARRPRSALCLPFLRGFQVAGMLYLEHAELAAAFTQEQFGTLELIATQAAISFENAGLYDQLREVDRRKSEFLAVLSHELRNPLAPIRNSLFVLDRAEPGSEQAHRARAVMDRQVRHLTRLVDDLLDVTRINRGRIELKRERLDLNEVAQRTAEDYRATFGAAGVQFVFLPAPTGVRVWVDGDRTRLAQVMGNLLHNAAKFTSPGGKVSMSVESDSTRGQATVRVRDTGKGIAPALIPQLFKAFTQADESLDRSKGGLGLGLALVKGIAELHGGSASAASDGPGRGAIFTVTLPIERAIPTERSPRRTDSVAPARRVLVIEDNADAADSLCEVLELIGHLVAVAYNGPEGLEKAHLFHPDVVICDIGLPEMDGYAVARALRADADLGHVSLVALSGYAQPEDVAKAKAAGFEAHIAKPPNLEALDNVLHSSDPPCT
jgi:predicted ATPase/signal transduction histidine kinase/ActR/RegA family two-component response regulator